MMMMLLSQYVPILCTHSVVTLPKGEECAYIPFIKMKLHSTLLSNTFSSVRNKKVSQ